MKKIIFLFCLIPLLGAAQSRTQQQKKKLYPFQVVFQNQVDSQLLSLDTTYLNPHRESFTVKNFRYYLGHFSFTGKGGKQFTLPNNYYLVDERKPESKIVLLQLPFTDISTVAFTIGVDSVHNVSGVQTGALDPANGMFWTWNSGYISAKLEGYSPASTAPQHAFTYHIGGFRSGENIQRKIVLAIDRQVLPATGNGPTLRIAANVQAWFSGSATSSIAQQPSCMDPGKTAMEIADRYARMFSIVPM